MSRNCVKLALGTVQFGLPYGIANKSGQITEIEAAKIIKLATESGVNTLDTAIAYGDSEAVLGKLNISDFNVISKLPELPENVEDVSEWVETQVANSLNRLKINYIHTLLLHRPLQLLQPSGRQLWAQLQSLKAQGVISRVGVSIYSPSELDLLCKNYHFDTIQAPFNVLDRRLIASNWLDYLEAIGTVVHVRSVFLQGLLLMNSDNRPAKFNLWSQIWDRWDDWLKESGQTALEGCLKYVSSFRNIERLVVGVDSVHQFSQILSAMDGDYKVPPEELSINDSCLLNPSEWNQL